MAVRTAVPIEEYLRTDYEHDREYVRGEVVERGMPTLNHARTQAAFAARFRLLRKTKQIEVCTELRNRMAEDLVRIPDVSVYLPAPAEQVPASPPLAAIEILSPDDRHRTLVDKCHEYLRWGVPHIWVVDPDLRTFQVFTGKDLLGVAQLEAPELDLAIAPAEIFD